MSESHDPVKDALKHLFGKDKPAEEKDQQPTPASDIAQAAAALGQQAVAQNSYPSNPFADTAQPAEQSPSYANPFGNNTQPAEQPAPTTYTNPFADNATLVPAEAATPAQDTAPAPVQDRPAENQAAAHAEESAPPPSAPASNPDVESINGHAVGFAFLRYYKQHPEIGLPVDEQHGNVGGYQMFEHAILHWDGSNVQVEQRGGGQQGGGQRTYTVKSGDNLSAIAQQFYGDARQWRRIFDANRDKISNPDLIHPGQQFVIP